MIIIIRDFDTQTILSKYTIEPTKMKANANSILERSINAGNSSGVEARQYAS